MPMLSELISGLNLEVLNFQDLPITGISYDSRRVKRGEIFIAIKGMEYDGYEFLPEVVRKGAVAVVTERKVDYDLIQIITGNPRRTMAELAIRFYHPIIEKITLIGITGTNGKTTTAYLLRSILYHRGCGLIGSIEYDIGRGTEKSHHTTPEILDTMKLIEGMVKNGLRFAVIEVTSHGLKMDRVFGLPFPIRIFTNISRDHLDFHPDFEDYQNTKLSFFSGIDSSITAIINRDDQLGRRIIEETKARVVTYGLEAGDYTADRIITTQTGIEFLIRGEGREFPIKVSLLGRHNVYNCLAAFATARTLGIDPEEIEPGLARLTLVPGRCMPVGNARGLRIYIDFAHTPEALRQVLTSLREFTPGRIIVVFGCGGDRDKGKRPLMGAVASELADRVIVTSDNPRREDPIKIIEAIVSGIKRDNYLIEPDRKEAIRKGIGMLGPDDSLLIAGKGHEEYQIIGTKRIPFNDAKVVQEILSCSP